MFCALYCLYIILLQCSFSSFIYIIKNMIHIPHYTYFFPLNKKSGYSHLSTRSIHLLLCVLYKLLFTEGTEQSNLLQCLCNAEKDNWIYRPHNKVLKCTHWKNCHNCLSIQYLQTQSIENDIADEHYYKLRSKHSPYGKLFLIKETSI